MTSKKSTTQLTDEQKNFYQLIRMRAVSEKFGQPYVAYAVFRLIPVNAPGLGTMAVDEHYRVYIDFDYMMEQGMEFASQVLNHEVWHPLRSHSARFRELNINHKLWNYAADMEINDDIVDRVPSISLFPKTYNLPDGQTAEWYAAELLKRQQQQNGQQNQQGQSGQGQQQQNGQSGGNQQGQQQGQGQGQGNNQSGQGQQQNGGQGGNQQNGQQNPQNGQGGNQSGQGGNQQDQQGNGGGGQGDDPSDYLGPNPVCSSNDKDLADYKLGESEAETVSEFDQEIISREVAQEAKDYAGRKPGSVPAGIQLWADAKLAPTPTPWQKVLRGALRSATTVRGQIDYVRSRPARRQPVKDVILPALRAPKPRVAMGVDTSGSHVPMLPRVLDEIHTIVKQTGVRGNDFKVFTIDTMINSKAKPVTDARKVNLKGGGGTDMMPAFKWAAEHKKDIDVFVLMTDGEVPTWPDSIPTNMVKFVVCILHFEDDRYGEETYKTTENKIGNWAKVVHIVVPREDAK